MIFNENTVGGAVIRRRLRSNISETKRHATKELHQF